MKKVLGSFLTITTVLLLTPSLQALPYGCQIMPKDAVKLTDKLIRAFYEKTEEPGSIARYLPNNLPINGEVQQEVDKATGDSIDQIKYEAILRPKKSDYFHLFHLIMFKLERTRNLMYVCLNHDSRKPKESHLTIYFMLAYGLERVSSERDNITTVPGDWLFGPGGIFNGKSSSVAQITRVPVELVPLHHLTDDVSNWTENIPLIEEVFKIPGTALKFSGVLLARINEKLGAGVERIEVTSKAIEFANSVDLDHPEKRNVLYRLELAELGLKSF